MKIYDENDAIDFIKQNVPEASSYSFDDLILVIDTMFDFYDRFDDDEEADESVDVDQMADYIMRDLARFDSPITRDHMAAIVKAELDYEATLDLGDDDES